jgi:hypothetical protein
MTCIGVGTFPPRYPVVPVLLLTTVIGLGAAWLQRLGISETPSPSPCSENPSFAVISSAARMMLITFL